MQVSSQFSRPFAVQVSRSASAVASRPHAMPTEKLTAQKTGHTWETGSFSFRDIIDAINPLQHIPIISTIYRKLTGDKMGYASRIVGDTLFGGVFGSFVSGLVSALTNVFVDSVTGKDIGEHLVASVQPAVQTTTAAPVYTKPTVVTQQQHPPILAAANPVQMSNLSDRSIGQRASHSQMAIDQYKWEVLAGEPKSHADFWG